MYIGKENYKKMLVWAAKKCGVYMPWMEKIEVELLDRFLEYKNSHIGTLTSYKRKQLRVRKMRNRLFADGWWCYKREGHVKYFVNKITRDIYAGTKYPEVQYLPIPPELWA